jgi:hypothetical protein
VSAEPESATDSLDADSRLQLRERLTWTPAERLQYLCDMLAFEGRARGARRVR